MVDGIPGPNESEEEFNRRMHYCLHLKERLVSELGKNIPFTENDLGASGIIEEPLADVEDRYKVKPSWIPVFFSRHQLLPWHGGLAWIFQLTKEEPTAGLIQLRPTFKKNRKFMWIYDRKELIAHELCHIGRMMYNEPVFEEFLAYRTSNSQFRRTFGPIIQSSFEGLLFVLTLFAIFLIDFSMLFSGQELVNWLKLIPLGLAGFAIFRLRRRHRVFNETLKKLNQLSPHGEAILYRLTDEEIFTISKLTVKDTLSYLTNKERTTLREKQIKELLKPPEVTT